MNKVSRNHLGVVLAVVLPFFILFLALSASHLGIIPEIEDGGLGTAATDISAVPQSVTEDAQRLANQLYGDSREDYDGLVKQLLEMYVEAKDKDFVVFFNPGGWGWNSVDSSPGWRSIFTGIEAELEYSGYTSLLLTYQRTVDSLQGRIDEVVEILNGYSSKAEELACRVEFLTANVPELKVIVAGESNGTIISDIVMNDLQHNSQVYCIQTGPPFWRQPLLQERTLILDNNGITADSFSQGDILSMFWASLKATVGLYPPENDHGNVLYFVRAPGHDYRWHYPNVYSRITDFLNINFGFKSTDKES